METKLDIIEQIEILRYNHKKYSYEEYQKKLIYLHTKLSQSIQKINLYNNDTFEITQDDQHMLFNQILNSKTQDELLKLANLNKLSNIFPLFDMYLMENNIIEFKKISHYVQTVPIIKNYDKNDYILKTKLLFHLNEISITKNNKAIIFIILLNEIFVNYKFLIDCVKYALGIKNKINEFNDDENTLNTINIIIKKYDLDINTFIEWRKKINTDII